MTATALIPALFGIIFHFFHELDPGSVASCSSHNALGGFAKADIVEIFKDLERQTELNWSFLQNGLFGLKSIRDVSMRLPAKMSFSSLAWKHAGVATFL
jgi:hypothetical protein